MGVGALQGTSRGLDDTLRLAFAITPEGLKEPLKPLLTLDLHGLCEAHRRLATSACNKISVTTREIEALLGLAPRTTRLLAAGRTSLSVLDLLTLLTLLSLTHAMVKARFIFCIFDPAGNGELSQAEFRSAAAALLWACCSLSQLPRDSWPKQAAVDSITDPLFAPHSPAIRKDDFVALAMNRGRVGQLLRRFSRCAVVQHFLLGSCVGHVPSSLEGGAAALGGAIQSNASADKKARLVDASLPHAAKGQGASGNSHNVDVPDGLPSILPVGSAEVAPHANRQATLNLYTVPPRRPQTARRPQTPGRPGCTSGPPARPSPRGKHGTVDPGAIHCYRSGSSGPSLQEAWHERGLPRRRGYFQAVQTTREAELLKELEKLQQRKLELAGAQDLLHDSALLHREDELLAEIEKEVEDNGKRDSYRRRLQQVLCGSVHGRNESGIHLPAGRLWSASKEHVARGGVLPYQFKEPLTPTNLQQYVQGTECIHDDRRKSEPEVRQAETPRLSFHAGDIFATAAQKAGAITPFVKDDGSESTITSSDSDSGHANQQQDTQVAGAERRDVLLAFELYRTCYWSRAGLSDIEPADTVMERRDLDIMAILEEEKHEVCPPPRGAASCSSHGLTLRGLLKSIWPKASAADMQTMLCWIQRSRKPLPKRPPPVPESAESQAETIRELVDLFDAIDVNCSGLVPLEAVERFLCGELLTVRELEQIDGSEAVRHGCGRSGDASGRCGGYRGRGPLRPSSPPSRSVLEFETYVDSIREPRRARFLGRRVADRDEWSVAVSDKERRWAVLKRSSMEDYGLTFENRDLVAARQRQLILCRIIGHRMERLAKFLDDETVGINDPEAESSGGCGMVGAVHSYDLDTASMPNWNLHFPEASDAGAANHDGTKSSTKRTEKPQQQLRLVRLYWRYLLGSAVQQQLRNSSDRPGYLCMRPDGQLDLVSFVCALAHDQVLGLFPKEPPTAELMRKTVYVKGSNSCVRRSSATLCD